MRHLKAEFDSVVPRGTKGVFDQYRPIADFCKVTAVTVSRWFREGDSNPIGDTWIKMICYLDLIGYKVIELENMGKTFRHIAEIVGYGLMTGEQVLVELDYSQSSRLKMILTGEIGISDGRSQKMYDIWKARHAELDVVKAKMQERYRKHTIRPAVVPIASSAPLVLARAMPSREQALVSIMEGITSLLDEAVGDQADPRVLIGLNPATKKAILHFSARLSAISSKLIVPGNG